MKKIDLRLSIIVIGYYSVSYFADYFVKNFSEQISNDFYPSLYWAQTMLVAVVFLAGGIIVSFSIAREKRKMITKVIEHIVITIPSAILAASSIGVINIALAKIVPFFGETSLFRIPIGALLLGSVIVREIKDIKNG